MEKGLKNFFFSFSPEKNILFLYFQSFSSSNMGWKIHIVDELPTEIADFTEEPYHDINEAASGQFSSSSSCFSRWCTVATVFVWVTFVMLQFS